MLLGVLKTNSLLTDIEKVFISVAHERGHQAFVFSAKDVNFETRLIKGTTLINNLVASREFEFPQVIQNRLAVKKDELETYLKLSKIIPFTSNRVGTKKQVYDRIKNIEKLSKYLIEVVSISQADDLVEYIDRFKKVIAKPASSNQGKGIYTFEKDDNTYIVRHMSESFKLDKVTLKKFFDKDLGQGLAFNFSPFIKSETHLGQSTVFRLHIVRGAKGKWKKIKFFPYVNLNSSVDITNGMQGALITTREALFLEQFYPNVHKRILSEIDQLFQAFVETFPQVYLWSFDALGLDLGITQDGNVYIYEINAGPGVGFMAYPVACEQVLYAEWLAENAKPPFKYNFVPLNLQTYMRTLMNNEATS